MWGCMKISGNILKDNHDSQPSVPERPVAVVSPENMAHEFAEVDIGKLAKSLRCKMVHLLTATGHCRNLGLIIYWPLSFEELDIQRVECRCGRL